MQLNQSTLTELLESIEFMLQLGFTTLGMYSHLRLKGLNKEESYKLIEIAKFEIQL